jgi:murein DD-endopeptidase MepM/ murein hydrolase activator NlpD
MKFKKLILLIIPLVVISTFSLTTLAATPEELQEKIEEARRERETLLEEQKKLQAELATITSEGKTLQGAVSTLDATKKKLANDIKLTQSKINASNLNIQSLENSMTEKEYQISAHKNAIKASIQELSRYDSQSLVHDILTYEEVSDVWRDRGSLDDLTGRLKQEIAILENLKVTLGKQKVEKEKTKVDLVNFQGELSGQKKVVEETQTAKARLLAETKNKEVEYQKLLALNLQRQIDSEKDLFALESQLKIVLDPKLIPNAKNSILAWPLANVFVTQRFGKTEGSARLYASGSHNGIDFRATVGTPILAALDGVVEGAGNTDEQRGCYSYGRWVLIKHGNGLSTVYAHMSGSLVRKGDTVHTGQVIGYSGGMPGQNGSGYSTGPHLHLGLFASQGVQVRQFTTSIGCKQVFVPMADIQAYLDPLAYLPPYN